MTARIRIAFVVILSACASLSQQALAQTTSGEITGRVVDQSGRTIPAAEVTLTNKFTNDKRVERTNDAGEFVFVAVQPGTFSISVTAPSFKTFTKQDLVLTASERLSAGMLTMEVGSVTESVTVGAAATPVQTESGERSALLDNHQLATLIDPSRNFMNLTRILPGVVATNSVGTDELGIFGIDTVNGVRSEYSTATVDGVDANTNARGIDRVETPPNLDAIAEVKVLANNFQAEYGGASGSLINAVTKSGTRDFHGTLYYYNRNEAYNAADFFNGLEKTRFNTIGYNVGGPVWYPHAPFNRNKDKLFFFFSQEIWPTTHPGDNDPYQITVPTALERIGDFSKSRDRNGNPIVLTDPKNCGSSGSQNCLLDSTHLNPAFVNPSLQKLLNLLPLPTANLINPDACPTCNFATHTTEKNPVNQRILRLDYNVSDKWRTYLRAEDMSVRSQGNDAADTPMIYLSSTLPVDYDNRAPNVALNVTYLASPTLVNELNVGWASWSEDQVFPRGQSELAAVEKSALGVSLSQFNSQVNPLGLIPVLMLGGSNIQSAPNIGFAGSTGARFPIHSVSNSYGFTDSLTKIWQNHITKVGVYFHIDRFVQAHVAGAFAGQYDFTVRATSTSPLDSGDTFANALLGNFYTYQESTAAPYSDPITRILDWYVQDKWKITKRLTIEPGLRFSWDMPQTLFTGANFVPGLYHPSQAPVLYQPVCKSGFAAPCKAPNRLGIDPTTGTLVNGQLIGAVVPGSGNPFDGTVTINNTNVIQSQGVLVAPRLGFAWDIFGDGKTVLRGGSGIFYNSRAPSAQAGNLSTNPPVEENPTYPFGNVSQLFGSSGTGLIFPSNLVGALPTDGKRPAYYNTSFGVQRALPFSMVLDVAYVGTLGRHLGQQIDLNALPPGTRFLRASQDPTTPGTPLPDNFLRRYVGLGSIPFTEFTGTSNYNALQTSLTRRFTRGFSIGANFTWSKALDYADSSTSTVGNFAPLRVYSYGLASFDRDKLMKINWLWNLPAATHLWNNRVIRTAFDDWQLSGIATFSTGAPTGITISTSTDLTGGGDPARVVLTGNPILPSGQRSVNAWFNTSVIAEPAVNAIGNNGQYATIVGNAGKIVFRGPGSENFDAATFKNFKIRERLTFQLRGEFYNLFNHPSFNKVNNTASFNSAGVQSNKSFGKLIGDLGPRQIQLAGRITF